MEKTKPKDRKKLRDIKQGKKKEFYYSFLTIVLIFCLIQIGYGAILNITKIISYKGKIVTLENFLKKAQMRNDDLKNQKKMITSDNSLEGIARNNLKMAGEDEVLIIINKKVEPPKKKKNKWNFKNLFKKHKNENSEENVDVQNLYIPEEVVEE